MWYVIIFGHDCQAGMPTCVLTYFMILFSEYCLNGLAIAYTFGKASTSQQTHGKHATVFRGLAIRSVHVFNRVYLL